MTMKSATFDNSTASNSDWHMNSLTHLCLASHERDVGKK